MTDRNIHKVFIHFATAVLLTAAVGCTSDSEPVAAPGAGEPVRIGAEVARQIYTRSYQESGKVTYGIYYLTYPLNTGTNNVANVNFNVEGSTPGVGMVIVPPDKELKWIDVGGSTPTFYLDNVKAEYGDAAESTLTDIVFNDENPFVAGIFDLEEEHPDNDLLWGSSMVSHGVKTVNFDLHHYMSRVRVQVSVDRENEKEEGDLDLEGATVSISSLVHKPYSYNRLNGTMSLGETPRYETLVMVNGDELDWAGKKDDNGDGRNDVYTTADFVLPPQGLLENNLRPELTITLKNGATYSGILPHAMEIVDEAHPSGGYPVALYFLKEYILTIRTVITEEPPTLAFMPVKVVEWVDKGDFTIEAHQAGIYTAEEFKKLISYYSTNNEYQLVRYGKLNQDDVWVFDFFHSVTLNYNDIFGCMKDRSKEQKDFSFNFNGYKIYILRSGATEPQATTPGELYSIVNGK